MAFAAAFGLAATILAIKGTDTESLRVALRMTARWSFLLFWIAYSGKAISALFGPAFAPLARRGREFGLAYAAAQLVHLGLVVWLFQISARPPLSGRLSAFFIVGIVWTYLLAVFSFGGPAETLGPRGWRTLRIAGMNYILFAFAFDFVPPVIRSAIPQYGIRHIVEYVPFAVMSVAAPLLVLAAAAHRRLELRYSRAGLGPVVN